MKTLKEIYESSFLIGNIYTPRLPQNATLTKLMAAEFNTITAENIMKPALIQPTANKFEFSASDEMVEFAKKHNFKVVGHTLAWHQQTLNWIDESSVGREAAIAILRTHITEIMTRYKGQIIAWDVLNEAIEDGVECDTKDWRKHLRDTPWKRMIGDDYINIVFEIAHELDENARLYYNDYNLNYKQKREAAYYMVKELKEAGVPIHGIGMQGHYHTNTPIATVEDSLALFSSLQGIEISVTELDVTVTGSENATILSKDHEIEQAQYYARLFNIYKKYSHVIKRVTFWGTDDVTSWRRERFPTIFNGDYTQKLSYDAIANPDEFLKKYPIVEKDMTQIAIANYGTPVLGDLTTWNKNEPIHVNRQLTAWEGAVATSYAMWDETYLYILAEVADKTPQNDDSLTLYLSPANTKKETYDAFDYQINITANGDVLFKNGPKIDNFSSISKFTETGYQIALKMPLPEVLNVDNMIGFDMQVTDVNDKLVKQSMAVYNDVTGALAVQTSGFGNLTFKNDKEVNKNE